jgi:hypothetical protein
VNARYHLAVLRRALAGRLSPRALAAVEAANLGQDSLRGLLHYHWHFDNSLFAEGLAYIEACRAEAASTAEPALAWAAFGRLSHAAHDFYSHSNYVALWLAGQPAGSAPSPDAIDGLDPACLRHPSLRSGVVYLPWEALALMPAITGLVRLILPKDSHAWMNLDSPATGPLFPFSIHAALQRTVAEFYRTLAAIGETSGTDALQTFLDLP